MPSEQPPPHNPSSTRQGPPEKLPHPPSRGGVRMLLGLPFSESGVLSTVALTAPSGRHRYGQSPLAAAEESDESFGETAPDEGVIEETRGAVADFPERLARSLPYETDTPRDFPRAPRRDGAPFLRAMRENAADARSTLTQPSAEQREQTRLVIPGGSTHRTAFPALSQTAATPTISVEGQRDAIPQQAASLKAPVSLPRAREMTTSNGELLTRLEQLVTEGVQTQKSSEARTRLSAPRAPGLPEPMGMESGERRGQDLADRVENLQRTVRDLAATVSSQVARNRNESQAQPRERKTAPPQRTVIIKRSEASSTTPRAFWERSRLGRFYLRTVR
jgi:hypothetical protein